MRGVTDRPFTIYAIRCTVNGKMYIGRSTNVVNRVRQHISQLRSGRKMQSIKAVSYPTQWQIEFNEYGEKAFEFYILEEGVAAKSAPDRELFWIEEYNAADPRCGYNRAPMFNRCDVEYSSFKRDIPPKPGTTDTY